ncbi:MAG: amidohydrolase family protein [Lachnotalea sp.]
MAILIKNAIIVDGTNSNAYEGDILVDKNKIAAIGQVKSFEDMITPDVVIIDAKGYIVSPGFIDTHSHSDLKVLTEPDVIPKLMQGITTEVLGQDGISMAPLPIPYISAWRKNLAGLDGESDEINWEYETTKNYLSMIEAAKPSLNESYLLPHGNVRMEAIGLDDREPSEEEIQKMCDITRREMQSGCLGLSSGLIYMPCAYSNTKEIIEICKVVKEFDGVFVVHQRSEADTIVTSMKEIIEIGRESGVRIHFSHFKVCGKKNWKYLDEMFELLDEAKKEGIQVSLDQYPYVAGSTMLSVILPPWAHNGGTDKLVKRLHSDELRTQMKKDMKDGIPGWDNFIDFAGIEGIYVTSVATKLNKNVVGLNLLQLGELKNKEPFEATFDLLIEEQNAVGMVDFYGLEDHVIKIMKRDEMNVCTDGLLSGTPHPRVYGSFARVLGKYVREEKVMGIEEAIYKMTGKAAHALGIKERGVLKVGYYADITIWNPDTINDKGTFENPKQFPEGIEYVLVNGEIAVDHAKYTKMRKGMVIRKSQEKSYV